MSDLEIEIIMSNSSFLSNLFDPSLVDPSFTEGSIAGLPNPSSPTTSRGSDDQNTKTFVECAINQNCTELAPKPNDSEFQQDIYFVLVVATCSLTVLIAISLAMYRMIDILLTSGSRRQRSNVEAGQQQVQQDNVRTAGSNQSNRLSSVEFLSGKNPMTVRAQCFNRRTISPDCFASKIYGNLPEQTFRAFKNRQLHFLKSRIAKRNCPLI